MREEGNGRREKDGIEKEVKEEGREKGAFGLRPASISSELFSILRMGLLHGPLHQFCIFLQCYLLREAFTSTRRSFTVDYFPS